MNIVILTMLSIFSSILLNLSNIFCVFLLTLTIFLADNTILEVSGDEDGELRLRVLLGQNVQH